MHSLAGRGQRGIDKCVRVILCSSFRIISPQFFVSCLGLIRTAKKCFVVEACQLVCTCGESGWDLAKNKNGIWEIFNFHTSFQKGLQFFLWLLFVLAVVAFLFVDNFAKKQKQMFYRTSNMWSTHGVNLTELPVSSLTNPIAEKAHPNPKPSMQKVDILCWELCGPSQVTVSILLFEKFPKSWPQLVLDG